MELKSIVFLKDHMPYKRGDVAGFLQHEADALVQAGIAKSYKPGMKLPKDVVRKVMVGDKEIRTAAVS